MSFGSDNEGSPDERVAMYSVGKVKEDWSGN